MKRSRGVTVWAVLLIIAGALTGTIATFSSVMRGQSLEAMAQSMKRLDALPTGTGEGQVTPEQLAHIRQRAEALRREVEAVNRSPIVHVMTWLAGLLGLAALIAGIGLFSLKGWARILAIWQAGLSILHGLFTMLCSPQRRLSEAALQTFEGLIDPGAQGMIQTGQAVGQWLGVLFLLVWNGLIIWSFTRPSVKAQCISSPRHGGEDCP